ncbi:hypothetical protein L798_12091 [Zootermopsis nevadensis]|uniref:Uncharacterized protein n=1 Tax=Zootermopsis nevadensis TaxID=136037 RepID=A0A067QUI9_ZOONE|nr:hypothetical protein L798_12091 [Zootermopsis nevadensis]
MSSVDGLRRVLTSAGHRPATLRGNLSIRSLGKARRPEREASWLRGRWTLSEARSGLQNAGMNKALATSASHMCFREIGAGLLPVHLSSGNAVSCLRFLLTELAVCVSFGADCARISREIFSIHSMTHGRHKKCPQSFRYVARVSS